MRTYVHLLLRYAQINLKMKITNCTYIIVVLTFALSCTQEKKNNESPEESLETTKDETIKIIAQRRPGGEATEIDLLTSKGLDNLQFANISDTEIDDSDLVIGIDLGETGIAVPIVYLDAYEVANLSYEANDYLLTWCPTVGSARIFEGKADGTVCKFDFGRALRDNNLLVVDRRTRSVWNQLSGEAIHGTLQGEKLTPLPTIQTTWGFWKNKYPDTKLLVNTDTTGAIFQASDKVLYRNWKPGDGRPIPNENHQLENLGIGIELDNSSVYFPFQTLFEEDSPIPYEIENQIINIHFNEAGLTAWAEDKDGNMITSSIVYDWAWLTFFPDTKTFNN